MWGHAIRILKPVYFFSPLLQKRGRTSCLLCHCMEDIWVSLKVRCSFPSPSRGWISSWFNMPMPSASGRRLNLSVLIQNSPHPAKSKWSPKLFRVFDLYPHLLGLFPLPLFFQICLLNVLNVGVRHSVSCQSRGPTERCGFEQLGASLNVCSALTRFKELIHCVKELLFVACFKVVRPVQWQNDF